MDNLLDFIGAFINWVATFIALIVYGIVVLIMIGGITYFIFKILIFLIHLIHI